MVPADQKSETKGDRDLPAPQAQRGQLVPAPPRDTPRPARRWWLWGAVGVLALALAAVIYSQVWMSRPTVVAVETAALAPVTRVLAVNGRIAAENSVEVTSVVTGTLKALPVAEGDIVEPGQILAQVDAQAEAALVRQAEAGLKSAREAQNEAREDLNRASALGGTVARSVRDSYAHRLETATQEVARLTAVLDQARAVLDNHTIRAPVAGSIVSLDVEQGQLVGPATPLLTLADLGALLVEADVDEAYATQIAPGQPAILQLAGETETRAGHVSYVSRQVDIATGGLSVELAFDTPVIAPVGLTVTTNIIVETRDAALSIPRTAMTTVSGETGVFVVQDGRATFRPVAVVDWPAARLIVTRGVAAGDRIITEATGITDGQAVAVEPP